MEEIVVFWFRRDLRLEDNAGLYHALKSGYKVLPIFIFDKNILEKLPNKTDKRVQFIHTAIGTLHQQLIQLHSSIQVYYDEPLTVYKQLVETYSIKAVYTNHDYEPYAKERDERIGDFFKNNNILFHTYKDQCIFEKDEVVKDDGKPYTVFTPYSRKWKKALTPFYVKPYPTEKYFSNFLKTKPTKIISLKELGFSSVDLDIPSLTVENDLIKKYKEQRDFPAIKGTSRLSVHLRFGTVSIRQLAKRALSLNETWLNELIWRDFYMMILWQFPYVATKAFKPDYDQIPWRNNEDEFSKWCEGKTGYPIVDAGMRELNATGFMHNRVRMIVASFLVKHLLIDWRWGEAYFAEKLLDFDLSANNGGWQWAASSGCDAVPYFRIFNPADQTKKFDTQHTYIKKWISEFGTANYPLPIVDHATARIRAINTYKTSLNESKQMKLF